MLYLKSAFDPIFYLHHCNVDRILAFWEYVYESYWMGKGYKNKAGNVVAFSQSTSIILEDGYPIDVAWFAAQSGGTWAADDDDKITEDTALQPFRKGDNIYWNSTNTRLQQSRGIAKGMIHSAGSAYTVT
jgi:tyrosinase